MLFLSAMPCNEFQYFEVLALSDVHEELPAILEAPHSSPRIKAGEFQFAATGREPWLFAFGKEQDMLQKVTARSDKLGDVTEQIFQGLITSADHIYILKKRDGNAKPGCVRVYFSPKQKSSRWKLLC
jgi:hypothetical protein